MEISAPDTHADAAEITHASKSNLAIALIALPRDRREDMYVFYAFCRVVDDIVDDPGQSVEARRAGLNAWRQALSGPFSGEPPLAAAVRKICDKHEIDRNLLLELIAGCEMDLQPAQYGTWEELRLYCHRVASCVGLASIRIFGCKDPASVKYAEALGLALQITNILRDVGEDFQNGGRIYLPAEDLARFGCTAEDIAAGRLHAGFVELMQYESARTRTYYAEAVASLPAVDRKPLIAAEIMRKVYSELLDKMEQDGFRVFGRRYSLWKVRKLSIIASTVIGSYLRG